MKEIIVYPNKESSIELPILGEVEILSIVLLDNKYTPIARYTFSIDKLKNIKRIKYRSNSHKIKFYDITPSTSCELVLSKEL